MNHAAIIDETGNYVNRYIKKHKNKSLLYHNIEHTRAVVSAVIQIADHYQLSDDDFFAVVIAAWFHDLGYYSGKADGHEWEGASLAAAYLLEQQISPVIVEKVRNCIQATAIPQRPETLLEQILCDADLFHVGTDKFFELNKLLRKEMTMVTGKKMSAETWRLNTIGFLEEHQYHTDYCRMLLDDKKQANLECLREKQLERAKMREPAIAQSTPADKKEKTNVPGRGVETMFRITSGNNQRLSDMADNKAHILITVNSIILSAIISLVLRKLDENNFLTYPTFSLLIVSVATIVISIIATRPSIPGGLFTSADIENKKVNLLFFGNFYRMSLEEYEDGMHQVMADSDFLYGTLIKDVYAQGVVLGHKYKLLRISYTVFMIGLIVSIVGYLLVFLMYK